MWYKYEGKDGDVVLNARVALSRNLENYPFADKMSGEEKQVLIEELGKIYRPENGWSLTDLSEISAEQRMAMAEQRIIDRDLAAGRGSGAVFQNEDYTVTVTVGGADHVRIEAVAPGNDLTAALDKALSAEALLDESAPIAYTEQFGYVTRSPELLGTGMRASLTLHLPLSAGAGWISRAAFRLSREGFSLSAADRSGFETGLFVVTNRETMGKSEEDLARSVTEAAEKLAAREREYRKSLDESRRESIAERVRRNYGITQYAKRLNVNELVSMYSELRMAAAMNLVDIPVPLADEAFFTCLPHTLAAAADKTASDGVGMDGERAARVREILGRAGMRNG